MFIKIRKKIQNISNHQIKECFDPTRANRVIPFYKLGNSQMEQPNLHNVIPHGRAPPPLRKIPYN